MRNRDMPARKLTKREVASIAAMQGYMASDTNDALTEEGIVRVAVDTADALFDELDNGERE